MGGIGRWGRGNGLDFWTALDRGEVDPAEIRAVDLLRRTTDPERFAYYCQTGLLPAMGNLTGRIYLLERGGAAIELEDGRAIASWCISIGPHRTDIPGTDHVVVLRNFVEGEELVFLNTGNRNTFGVGIPVEHLGIVLGKYQLDDWMPDLFTASIEESEDLENEEILELNELRPDKGFQVFPVRPAGIGEYLRPAGIQYLHGNDNLYINANQNAAGIGNYIQVQAPRPHLAQLVPRLENGIGVDMPDGRVLHINEEVENQLWRERGLRAQDEVNRMIEEGYTPEMIEHGMNDVIWW